MNLVILKGNLGNDPAVKTFDNGNKTASFSVATSESYTNKQGEKVTEVEWHSVVFYGPVCEVIGKHLHKGDQVLITGKNKTRKYTDKQGTEHWATEVIGSQFEFCGVKKESFEAKPDNWQGKKEPVKTDTEEQNIDSPF